MAIVSIEELEALSFFSVEPVLCDQDVPWEYNEAVYEITREELTLSFAIAPAYKDVRMIVHADGKRVYELNAVDVEDVRYSKIKGIEILEIVMSPRESIFIRVDPRIIIEQVLNGAI